MISISTGGMIVLLTVGYIGVNTIVKGATKVVRTVKKHRKEQKEQ